MVCKEEVCSWFKGLSCAKRLDLMCGLVHLCLPLEKRFLGTVLEDQCRTDYTSLRAEENRSNDPLEITKLSKNVCLSQNRSKCLSENRSKISVILCLMYSSNTVCSNIMYTLLNSIHQLIQCSRMDLDSKLIEDLLLILTMAVHHPAFSFDQRRELAELLVHFQLKSEQSQEVEDDSIHLECSGNSSSSSSSSSSPGSSGHTLQSHNQSNLVHVQSIELIKGSQRRGVEKKALYQLQVTWSDGTNRETYKTYQDFYNFHTELIKLFPKDSGAHKQERHIPFLRQEKVHSAEEMYEYMHKYVHELMSVPDYILQCDHMTSFFQNDPPPQQNTVCSNTHNQIARHQNNNKSDGTATSHSHFNQNNNKKNQASPSSFKERESHQSSSQNSPAHTVRSQIIYNSQFDADAKKMSKHDNSPGGQRSPRSPHIPVHSINNPVHITRPVYIPGHSPLSSPLASPMSSPYISPASSHYGGGSRPGSPPPFNINGWLKRIRLHKYTKNFAKYTIGDFLKVTDEDLEKMGLTKGAQKRFRTEIDNMKSRMKGVNGSIILETGRPKSPLNQLINPAMYNSHNSMVPTHSHNNSMVPTRALFLQYRPHSNASSREASPSSCCSEDYSASPADSPIPRQDGGNYSPRSEVTDSATSIDTKLSKVNMSHGSNGSLHRINSIGGGDADNNGLLNNMMGLHNMSIQTSSIVPPIRPMVYTIPPQGLLVPRQPFYRSPRQPLIRPDGSPGYMLPRIPNGVGPMGPHNGPMGSHNGPMGSHNGPVTAIIPAHTQQVNVHDTSMAVTTTSVSYAISQGTMTSPVMLHNSHPANGAVFIPTTAIPPPQASTSDGVAPAVGNVPRPNTLDIHQQQVQSSAIIQTSSVGTSNHSNGAGIAVQMDSDNIAINNSSSCSRNNKMNSVQVPGILNIAPVMTSACSSSNASSTTNSELNSNSGLLPTSSSMVFHSTTGNTITMTTGSNVTATVVSYSAAAGYPTIVASPSPSPVMTTIVGGGGCVGTMAAPPTTQCSPNPTPVATVMGLQQQIVVMPQQQPLQQTTIPMQQQQQPQHNSHSSCESPSSDCSCSKQLTNPPAATPPHQHQNQPPQHLPVNTTTAFPPHSYQPIWPTAPHPMFMGYHHTNGFINPANYAAAAAQTVHSYGVPTHHHHPHPNGITTDIMLHNHLLMNQAMHVHQQQQQQQFWSGHMQQHHYTGGGYAHHSGNGKGNKVFNCYNCGQPGHKACDCPEPTMEAITNQGTYHLKIKPPREPLD